jgi:hypothetical protein
MNMKRCVILIVLIVAIQTVGAQVLIQFNPLINGQNVYRLGNVTLNNRYAQELDAKLSVMVRELKQGKLLTVTTALFRLNQGINTVPASTWAKSSFQFAQSNAGYALSQTRNFMDGEYEYCYVINLFPLKGGTIPVDYYENCFDLTLERATPLLLTNPYDREVSCNTRPVFTWQPSMPIQPLVTYTFSLVELKPKQTKTEAMAYNMPLILQTSLKGNMLNYPAISPSLIEGKSYLWQVVAVNSGMITARSEIWEYKISCSEPQVKEEGDGYRELKENRDEGSYLANKWLRFVFYNPYGIANVDYTITDLSEKDRIVKKVPELKMQGGFNKYEIDLPALNGLVIKHQYLLTVNMSGGKKLYLSFIYKGEKDED